MSATVSVVLLAAKWSCLESLSTNTMTESCPREVLGRLAVLTRRDVELRVSGNPGPVAGAADSVISLFKAEVAGYDRVMNVMEQGETNVRLRRDAHDSDPLAGDAEQVINK
ncbi:hypothetical protein EDD21DRAFT_414421 [Dissophora ornata]|nr:hypothetical protein EDD21DRAFT_414421 [Dissophora ornata]